VRGTHLSEEGRQLARTLKSGLNRKRTLFNWEHLSSLSPGPLEMDRLGIRRNPSSKKAELNKDTIQSSIPLNEVD
jgi:hypothetical protein